MTIRQRESQEIEQTYNYCLQLSTAEFGRINLTDVGSNIKIAGELYSSAANLQIESIYNDDRGASWAKIHFNLYNYFADTHGGPDWNQNLDSYTLQLSLRKAEACLFFSTQEEGNAACTLFKGSSGSCWINELGDVTLELQLKSNNLAKKPLLKEISATCRAVFGDDYCKINIDNHSQNLKILSIEHGYLLVESMQAIAKYDDGWVKLGSRTPKIKNLEINKIFLTAKDLTKFDSDDIGAIIKIIPNCDKKFSTCCNKFNNAVNFRGEPHLPDWEDLEL